MPHPVLLGIECGGTKTVAIVSDSSGQPLHRLQLGPANLRLLSDAKLLRRLREVADQTPAPDAVGIGMAGVRGDSDCRRVIAVARKVWKTQPIDARHDLESALAASHLEQHADADARVIVLSGTGSCCYGRSTTGHTAKVGGWGHVLGDKGSGYEIGLRALKAVVYYFDRDGAWSGLGQRLLAALLLNEPDDLIAWVQHASKTDVARLAIEVFEAARRRDRIARDILAGAAHTLAHDAVTAARRLVRPRRPVLFLLTGSVLLRQPAFARAVARHIGEEWPTATVRPLRREGAWGAVELARQALAAQPQRNPRAPAAPPSSPKRAKPTLPVPTHPSPTEQRNPRSKNLDRLSLRQGIALMLREEALVPAAILAESPNLEKAIAAAVRAFRRGGRLIYAGAGTSGRLGVLDASECPPTFRTPPTQVQGVMAGGDHALWSAVEGAEDDHAAGARAVEFRGVTSRDVVVGIAASGRTPFVWGALSAARTRGACTVLVCFNPNLRYPRSIRPNIVIASRVGPEVLTGSTRLKAGTATKLILNCITTLAVVRIGKVLSNLMIDMNPSNAKLRDRALRIVQAVTRADPETARAALVASRWRIPDACTRLRGRT